MKASDIKTADQRLAKMVTEDGRYSMIEVHAARMAEAVELRACAEQLERERDALREQLAAPNQSADVPGWKLVPVEPTLEMMKKFRAMEGLVFLLRYKALLDAAPAPADQQGNSNGL